MRKGLIALIVAGALFAIGAFAASFSLNSQDVSSGADAVNTCATAQATVKWRINDSNAVLVTTTTAAANFLIDQATVTVPGCGTREIELAIERSGGETKCKGNLAADTKTFTLASADCTPGANLTVSEVTGAAVLVGDATLTPIVYAP